MLGDPVGFVQQLAEEYHPISRTRIGPEMTWVVSSPELIGDVLLGQHKNVFKDAVTRRLKDMLGEGLVTSEGELWKRQRRLAAPALQRRQIEVYARTMVECAADYAEQLVDGANVDVHTDVSAITIRIVVRTLFDADVADEVAEVERCLDTVLNVFDSEIHTWRYFLPQFVPTPARKSFARAARSLDTIISRYIDLERQRGAAGDHLLARLMAATDEEGSSMDATQLRDEVMTMFAAGHETTAVALTNTAWLLDQNPESAAKLDDELSRVLGDRDPTLDDLPKLEYCGAVIRESLRLHPPAWIIGREPQKEIEVGGYTVGKGDQILIPIRAMHHSERWFDQATEFVPERWLDGLEARLPKFVYMPFGGGPRVCIGNHFAMMELVLVLATLRRRLTYRVKPGFEFRHQPAVTLRPADGLAATVAMQGV